MILQIKQFLSQPAFLIGFDFFRGAELYFRILIHFSCLFYVLYVLILEQSYRDNMKAGNFDMVFNICWGMPYDPQSSLAAMRAPVYGDYAAQQGLEDKAEIDEAITKILTSTDDAERQELYKSVLTNLHEDAMYLPLTYECNKALYTSALHGVHFGTDQYDVPFADMYFE